MMRLQTVLLLLVIVAVALWGVGSVASGDPEPTPTAMDIAAQPTVAIPPTERASESPRPTAEPSPTARPTREPTATAEPTEEPTPEPTSEPTRPPAPEFDSDGAAVVIDRGDSGRLEVAFTFDAGEDAGYTEEILDLFAEYGVKATFGVTGDWAERHPELMQRIVDEGHQLINHTYGHPSFTGFSRGTDPLTADEREFEVSTTEEIFLDLTGYDSRPYFRFPYNDYDADALYQLEAMGYGIVAGYTCDTIAWDGRSAAEIEATCAVDAEDGGPGAVILMHVMQEQDYLALEPLMQAYLDAGYDIVTFEQIIQP